MPSPMGYDKLFDFVLSKNIKLLTTKEEYINTRQKLFGEIENGYVVAFLYDNLKVDREPYMFSKYNPYTIQNIELWCKLNNKPFEIISKEFLGNKFKLIWKCKINNEHIWEAEWGSVGSNKSGCPYCKNLKINHTNCFANTHSDLLKYWDFNKNTNISPYEISYGKSKKVWWKCENNHSFQRKVVDMVQYFQNCPMCTNQSVSNEYNLFTTNPELCKEWDYGKNQKHPKEYMPNSSKKVWWKCKYNHKWEAEISNRNNGTGCPKCKLSKGELQIKNILENLNINYLTQYKLENCKNKRKLPFDFAIFDNTGKIIGLIEYDGKLHFEVARYSKSTNRQLEKLKNTQYHDKIKNEYCKNNNILLLRIPYWEFYNIKEIILSWFDYMKTI